MICCGMINLRKKSESFMSEESLTATEYDQITLTLLIPDPFDSTDPFDFQWNSTC